MGTNEQSGSMRDDVLLRELTHAVVEIQAAKDAIEGLRRMIREMQASLEGLQKTTEGNDRMLRTSELKKLGYSPKALREAKKQGQFKKGEVVGSGSFRFSLSAVKRVLGSPGTK